MDGLATEGGGVELEDGIVLFPLVGSPGAAVVGHLVDSGQGYAVPSLPDLEQTELDCVLAPGRVAELQGDIAGVAEREDGRERRRGGPLIPGGKRLHGMGVRDPECMTEMLPGAAAVTPPSSGVLVKNHAADGTVLDPERIPGVDAGGDCRVFAPQSLGERLAGKITTVPVPVSGSLCPLEYLEGNLAAVAPGFGRGYLVGTYP